MDFFIRWLRRFFKKETNEFEMGRLSEEGKRDVLKRIKLKGIEKAVHKPFKVISRFDRCSSITVEFEGIPQRICVSASDVIEEGSRKQ